MFPSKKRAHTIKKKLIRIKFLLEFKFYYSFSCNNNIITVCIIWIVNQTMTLSLHGGYMNALLMDNYNIALLGNEIYIFCSVR